MFRCKGMKINPALQTMTDYKAYGASLQVSLLRQRQRHLATFRRDSHFWFVGLKDLKGMKGLIRTGCLGPDCDTVTGGRWTYIGS